ncbi:MAG TPA: hypothetical protein VNO22_04640 [Planctomycetota bacterium]|nr:hypothetical protein [Planctomycetota bacterium]
MSSANEKGQGVVFDYTVDGEPQETSSHQLTPRQIVKNAGLDPEQRYLIEIRGKDQTSYKDKMDEPIQIHEKQKFITAFIGPVPVS